ncbi:hypothetical protein OAQ84_01955, partial [Bdellovibrionales bacterium]|nr:hypothetical protein [Bdellovibrionales bacterium]
MLNPHQSLQDIYQANQNNELKSLLSGKTMADNCESDKVAQLQIVMDYNLFPEKYHSSLKSIAMNLFLAQVVSKSPQRIQLEQIFDKKLKNSTIKRYISQASPAATEGQDSSDLIKLGQLLGGENDSLQKCAQEYCELLIDSKIQLKKKFRVESPYDLKSNFTIELKQAQTLFDSVISAFNSQGLDRSYTDIKVSSSEKVLRTFCRQILQKSKNIDIVEAEIPYWGIHLVTEFSKSSTIILGKSVGLLGLTTAFHELGHGFDNVTWTGSFIDYYTRPSHTVEAVAMIVQNSLEDPNF